MEHPQPEFKESNRFSDAVESDRELVVGVCVGMIQLRIEGGRINQRSSFLLQSEDVMTLAYAIRDAQKEIAACYLR